MNNVLNKIIGIVYKNFIKPILFQFDAERVHNEISYVGETLENQKWFFGVLFPHNTTPPKKNVLGLSVENPIGLAAGFDYDGHLAKTMGLVGFGFNTVGTVTAREYEGNTPPRLARLPRSQSLLVNKGFKSEGAKKVAERLDKKNLEGHCIGISVGSSNIKEIDTIPKAIDDYRETFSIFKNKPYVKYFELNISCPNTTLTESFTTPTHFNNLLKAVTQCGFIQPLFIKMPNEIGFEESDALVRCALTHNVRGFIFSNLVKKRDNPALNQEEILYYNKTKGNLSGKPTAENSLKLIKHTRETFGNTVVIIGCGGIFSLHDAQERLRAGADLIQLITGMIYEGPQLIRTIEKGLI